MLSPNDREQDAPVADQAPARGRSDSHQRPDQQHAGRGVPVEPTAGQASELEVNAGPDGEGVPAENPRRVAAPSMPPSTGVATSSWRTTGKHAGLILAGAGGATRAYARVLGHPALLDADRRPVRSIREAAVELLVFLAVHRDGVSTEAVKEAVYGEASGAVAAQRLSTDLANLSLDPWIDLGVDHEP